MQQVVDFSALKSWPSTPVDKYSYGQVQVPIYSGHAIDLAVRALHAKLPQGSLMAGGIEHTPHITVRYGVKDEDYQGIRNYLSQLKPFTVKMGNTDVFPASASSDGASVLHVQVHSPELAAINSALGNVGNFKLQDFDYTPHMTVAFMSPEVAKLYAGSPVFSKYTFNVQGIELGKRDGAKEMVRLGVRFGVGLGGK